jgi:dolichyl-diphosphooligosaccharide--protein glycosyltransferase
MLGPPGHRIDACGGRGPIGGTSGGRKASTIAVPTPPTQAPQRAASGRPAGPLLAAALAGAVVAAFALRALSWHSVFPGDGSVLLEPTDGSYHARRALYSFARFPRVLVFDPFIAFPSGALVPMPPLYDWALGAAARLLGSSPATFERVAAWASPVLGALCVLPVAAIGRAVAGAGTGVAAAWLYAAMPGASILEGVGNPDHHAAVALLAALWLASSAAETRRPRPLLALAHAGVVAAMLLSWSGSLLYLALGEGSRFAVAAVASGSPQRLLRQAATSLGAAALVAPWLLATPPPAAGPFTSTTLSWLHVVALVALAVVCAAAGALARARPEPRAARRALRAGLLVAAVAGPLLLLTPLGAALGSGFGFVAKADAWAAHNPEQLPLFFSARSRVTRPPEERFGLFVWLVPLTPLLVGLRLRGEAREARWLLLAWGTALSWLALDQVRFAHDYAVPGSVVFAWTVAGVRDRLARRIPPPLASALACAAGIALLAPALRGFPRLEGAWAILRHGPPERRMLSPLASARAFGRTVQQLTPEPPGFLDPEARPDYGLIVPAGLGHLMLYHARRPVPANNFGPYLDEAKFADVRAFYAAAREEDALAIADRLRARYVLTADGASLAAGELEFRLHRQDGAAGEGAPHVAQLRLLAEGPARGSPIRFRFPKGTPRGTIPYKLFERVEGAVIEVPAAGGSTLVASLRLRTNLARSFVYRAEATAGADGVARLRVPYPTTRSAPTHAEEPWQLSLGGLSWRLELPEGAVARGEAIRLQPPSGAGATPVGARRSPAAAAGPRPDHVARARAKPAHERSAPKTIRYDAGARYWKLTAGNALASTSTTRATRARTSAHVDAATIASGSNAARPRLVHSEPTSAARPLSTRTGTSTR